MQPTRMYGKLLAAYGKRGWWPAKTPFEVIAGAILTQQTAWKNVEKAIQKLEKNGLNDGNPAKIAAAPLKTIQECVKCTGFYRQKATRLKKTAAYFTKKYPALEKFLKKPVEEARGELLSLEGIGPETADSILLYAAGKPVFVIDAYTVRIAGRALGKGFKNYAAAREFFEKNVPKKVGIYKEFHALLVELGKRNCKTTPVCAGCPLETNCLYAKNQRNQVLGAPRQ